VNKAEILEKTKESLRGTRSAKASYEWAIRDFLGWTSEISPSKVLEYLEFRERKGDGHYTLKMRFYALKHLLNEVLEIPFNVKETQFFATRERRKRPEPFVFNKEEILKIIKAVKEKGLAWHKAIFAVSTIYGCRRGEIQAIRKEDLNFKEHTITIFSMKAGREAVQLIPLQIEPYLKEWSWTPQVLSWFSSLFQEVMKFTFGRSLPGVGYHSIRHSLISELHKTELKADEIYNFMRWAEPGILAIYAHHYKPGEIEERVFRFHPFLNEWSQ